MPISDYHVPRFLGRYVRSPTNLDSKPSETAAGWAKEYKPRRSWVSGRMSDENVVAKMHLKGVHLTPLKFCHVQFDKATVKPIYAYV